MKYNAPYGIVDEDAAYINGNPSTGQMGSIPPAASIEYPQREIVNLITHAGIATPDNADLQQLSRAIQSGKIWYGVDAGTINQMQVTLTPAPLAYYAGLTVAVKAANTNTGPVTLNVNALGPAIIVRPDGSALVGGDIAINTIYSYRYDGTNWQCLGLSASQGRSVLSQPTTLYVNTSTGNDTTRDGSSATVGTGTAGPFKTIQRAMVETGKYAPGVFGVTIMVSAGTYNEAIYTATYACPNVTITGAGITQTFITGATSTMTVYCAGANTVTVEQLCVSTGTGNGPPCAFLAGTGSRINTRNTASGNCTGAVWEGANGGTCSIIGNHTFNAGSVLGGCAVQGFAGGAVTIFPSINFTLAGALTCAAFAGASVNGVVTHSNAGGTYATFTNAGACVGSKYTAFLNGVIYVGAAGTSFFPGNSAGTLGTGGQYG